MVFSFPSHRPRGKVRRGQARIGALQLLSWGWSYWSSISRCLFSNKKSFLMHEDPPKSLYLSLRFVRTLAAGNVSVRTAPLSSIDTVSMSVFSTSPSFRHVCCACFQKAAFAIQPIVSNTSVYPWFELQSLIFSSASLTAPANTKRPTLIGKHQRFVTLTINNRKACDFRSHYSVLLFTERVIQSTFSVSIHPFQHKTHLRRPPVMYMLPPGTTGRNTRLESKCPD